MPGWTNPNHQGAIGYDWSRYNQGGNLGMSAPGSRSPTGNPAFTSADPNYEYKPWMADTSVQWGGGPHGYLPIGYQGQDFSYYQNAQNLAPWEQQYMQDTWTQNFDPNSPTGGYINTRHG
jgi:hypothetical protein